MEKERLNVVVVKEEENTKREDRMNMKEKYEKKEKTKQEENKQKTNGCKTEGQEKSEKFKVKRKKKVEVEKKKENKKENIEEEKRKEEFMKKKEKKVEQEKHMKELANKDKEEYGKLKEEKEKKNKGESHKEGEKKTKESNEVAQQKEDPKGRNFYPQFFKAIFPKKPIEKLRIPQAFNEFLENESLGVVSLKGPSGNTWHAKLVLDSEGFYFTHGWNEFFIDHNINLGDFLVFGYDGHSQFSVRIFDLTSCEKQSALLACPSKDVTQKDGKELISIDITKNLPCSHEDYKGHKATGGLQDVDYLRNCVTNTLEYKDQGQGVDAVATLEQDERENMSIYTHDTSATSFFPRAIEKTIKLVDDRKDESPLQEFSRSSKTANDRLSRASFHNKRKASKKTTRKSNIALSCDKSIKDVPRKGSLRMNAEKVSPFQNSPRM